MPCSLRICRTDESPNISSLRPSIESRMVRSSFGVVTYNKTGFILPASESFCIIQIYEGRLEWPIILILKSWWRHQSKTVVNRISLRLHLEEKLHYSTIEEIFSKMRLPTKPRTLQFCFLGEVRHNWTGRPVSIMQGYVNREIAYQSASISSIPVRKSISIAFT